MRQSCLVAAIGSALLMLASPVVARDAFEIPDSFPETYEDLYKVIKKDLEKDKDADAQKKKEKENISAYLDGAQCGGWNMDLSVGGRIASISNAPGHNGQWDGNIPSGMAARNADLSYPGGADGLATACEKGKDNVERSFWTRAGGVTVSGYDVIVRSAENKRVPYFEDPPCLWREENGQPMQIDGPHTPPKCQEFCGFVNTFTYEDCQFPTTDLVCDDAGNCIDVDACAQWGNRYTCSEEWVNDPLSKKNCSACVGEECRCSGTEPSCKRSSANNLPFASFHRKYVTRYERASVPDALKDVSSKDATAACYGFYEEFDPKTHQTQDKDKRCIIDIDLKMMKETQLGKGQYGQNSNLPDPTPAKRNDGKYDEKKDLWYTHLGQAFSLLNDLLFTDSYDRSLSKVLAENNTLDKAQQKTTVQLTDEKPLAEHSYTRAFDETAESRMLTTWWQTQQTRLQTFVHGPVLRLILPSTWAIGASTDPFLQKTSATKEESLDERSKRIEVQIRAGDDTLGEAISFVDRSLTLQVTEEPVYIIIPLADPMELRALAASWCAWASAKDNKPDCNNAEEKVKTLIDDLYAYADALEEYRTLRADVSEQAATLLKLQQDVTKPLTDWLKKNINEYKESVASRRKIAEEIAPILRKAQDTLHSFHDDTNMPWCMNQRFTLPIYSLLDPWLPSRTAGGAISADGLPSLPDPGAVPEDIVLDLSKITYMRSSMTIPVLKPTQVRLTLPRPPNTDDIKELPDLGKDIQKIRDALKKSREQLPTVKQKGTPPTITLPKPVEDAEIQKMKKAAGEMVTLFEGMKKTYDDFWKSMGPLEPNEDEPEDETDGAKEAREQRNKDRDDLVEKKRNLECDWATFPCIHVEMDLLERFMRVASRPLVMLREDYASKGTARTTAAVCPPEDHVCLLLHPEKTLPSQGWEIRGPQQEQSTTFLDTIRSALRSLTFSSPLGSADEDAIPPYDTTQPELLPGIVSTPSDVLLPDPS